MTVVRGVETKAYGGFGPERWGQGREEEGGQDAVGSGKGRVNKSLNMKNWYTAPKDGQ